MKTAQTIKINYYTKAAYEAASSLPCPRSVSDVYNLGVSLHYCVRAKYIEIADLMNEKAYLTDQAAQQLQNKFTIEKLAAYNLNVQLGKFYAEGGPIMEDPVTNETAAQIQPFFSRNMSRFLQTLDELSGQVLTKRMSGQEMTAAVDQQMAESLAAMKKMFQDEEIQMAFADLIEMIPSRS